MAVLRRRQEVFYSIRTSLRAIWQMMKQLLELWSHLDKMAFNFFHDTFKKGEAPEAEVLDYVIIQSSFSDHLHKPAEPEDYMCRAERKQSFVFSKWPQKSLINPSVSHVLEHKDVRLFQDGCKQIRELMYLPPLVRAPSQLRRLWYFCLQVRPKPSWSRRGWGRI